MKLSIAMLLGLLSLCVAMGATAADRWKDIEASMVVTGTIEVNPDGSVYAWALDQQDQLPPSVINIVKATLPTWKFEPVLVNGKPVLAKARMSLRIVAQPTDNRHATIRIAGAVFGRDAGRGRTPAECPPRACLSYDQRHPPRYPMDMLMDRVSGTVYLLQEIDSDGRVVKQAVRQVDLRRLGESRQMAFWRHAFAQASLKAAKSWTYKPPIVGDEAAKKHWVVTIPINYTLVNVRRPERLRTYGQWEAYVPGPVQGIPWAKEDAKQAAASSSADAIPYNGGPFVADTRFVLLTPLADGGTSATAVGDPAHG